MCNGETLQLLFQEQYMTDFRVGRTAGEVGALIKVVRCVPIRVQDRRAEHCPEAP